MVHTRINLNETVGMWVLNFSVIPKDKLFTQLLVAN